MGNYTEKTWYLQYNTYTWLPFVFTVCVSRQCFFMQIINLHRNNVESSLTLLLCVLLREQFPWTSKDLRKEKSFPWDCTTKLK